MLKDLANVAAGAAEKGVRLPMAERARALPAA
jgi:hypothetical protein